eukprot:11759898-Ditylum_brightwellii.AAC.1
MEEEIERMIQKGIFEIVPRSQVPIYQKVFVPSGPTGARQNLQVKSTAIGHEYVQMIADKQQALTTMKPIYQ